jgi:alkylhydroperoxidase family enzyme
MHAKHGETEQRIYALSAWRDTPFFDEQEQAILALTEEVTLIAKPAM